MSKQETGTDSLNNMLREYEGKYFLTKWDIYSNEIIEKKLKTLAEIDFNRKAFINTCVEYAASNNRVTGLKTYGNLEDFKPDEETYQYLFVMTEFMLKSDENLKKFYLDYGVIMKNLEIIDTFTIKSTMDINEEYLGGLQKLIIRNIKTSERIHSIEHQDVESAYVNLFESGRYRLERYPYVGVFGNFDNFDMEKFVSDFEEDSNKIMSEIITELTNHQTSKDMNSNPSFIVIEANIIDCKSQSGKHNIKIFVNMTKQSIRKFYEVSFKDLKESDDLFSRNVRIISSNILLDDDTKKKFAAMCIKLTDKKLYPGNFLDIAIGDIE